MVKFNPESDEPTPSLLDMALSHAEGGYFVHPLKPNGKEPLTRHGFKDATRDPEQIRRWWAKWPNANIGISCGPSGIVVVDLDVKPDPKTGQRQRGPENWVNLTAGLEGEPSLEVVTPTGGRHLYWRGAGVMSSNGVVAPGVDIKAEGGYVLAPGSVIDGVPYRVVGAS